jgi:hypothetical protein
MRKNTELAVIVGSWADTMPNNNRIRITPLSSQQLKIVIEFKASPVKTAAYGVTGKAMISHDALGIQPKNQ